MDISRSAGFKALPSDYRGVRRLLLLLMGNGRVHMDQTQEVQTERGRQTAKQPAGAFAFY